MKRRVTDLQNHKLQNRPYLLDANIWLFLLDPPYNNLGLALKYQRFFESLASSRRTIIMPVLLWSEVVNRYLKIYCNLYHKIRSRELKQKGNRHMQANNAYFFKHVFRDSYEYNNAIERLFENFYALTGRCKMEFVHDTFLTQDFITSKSFGEINLGPSILQVKAFLSGRSLDVADAIYYMFVRNYQAILVTHDADFIEREVDIEIVTALPLNF